MIILDLEWNRGYDKKKLDEVLQIGAVKIDHFGGPITDTFNAYIRPQVHKSFGPGAKELPELTAYLESEIGFADAMAAFQAWRGEETECASWGGDDLQVLAANCAYWGLPSPGFERTYDLQAAFGYLVGAGRQQVALFRAVAYCGIPDVFTFHNALCDAVYTAILSGWITEEALDREPARSPRRDRSRKFCVLPFKKQPKLRSGPLAAPEQVLNAKRMRRPACPLCGRRAWVTQWKRGEGRQYYSPFQCPEHGRFLCRLTLSRTEDGRWQGRMTVPTVTEELKQAYQKAKAGEAYPCKGTGRKKKRRRRKRLQEG